MMWLMAVWPYALLAVLLLAAFQPWLLRRLATFARRDRFLAARSVALPALRHRWPLAAALIILLHGAALAAGLLAASPGFPLPVLIGLSALTTMIALTDWRALWLPDALVVPLGLAGLAANLAMGEVWFLPVIGAAAGYLVFLVLRLGYRRLRGVEGLGGGDVHLAAAMGAWTGPENLSFAVLLSCLLALLATPLLFGRATSRASRLPLGSFLACGLFVAVAAGPLIG
jgi:leader peptidase (prepilin peptidase) / N-methyltransferase